MDRGASILVVDDDASVRIGLERILDRHGYSVKTADAAESALTILDAQSFDLVITDVQMPGMDGLNLLAAIKQRSPHIAVVVITAYGSTEIVIQALRNGVDDFLTKPFQPKDLLSIVEREIDRHRLEEPAGVLAGLARQLSLAQLDDIDRIMAELRAEIGARCVLLVESNGYLIDAKGAIEDINVSALAALVSGDFAASSGIASLIGEGDSFRLNYHAGDRYSVYTALVVADIFLLIVFGQEVKSGMVLYYTGQVLPQLKACIEQAPTTTPSPVQEAGTVSDVETMPAFDVPEQSGQLFSLDEIQQSGLLDENSQSSLDGMFSNLWSDDQ